MKSKKIKAQLGLDLDPGPKKKVPTFTPSFDQLLQWTPLEHNLYGPDWDAKAAHNTARESSKLASNPLEQVQRTDKLSELQPYTPMDFSKDPAAKRRKDLLGDSLLALGLVNALVPDKTPNINIVKPEISYNPNMYGTGSQAIFENGGKLSASKAKEMLKDGTANGKKLTKKQKQYFGMVAAGKAELGAIMGPGPKFKKTVAPLSLEMKLEERERDKDSTYYKLNDSFQARATQRNQYLERAKKYGEEDYKDTIDLTSGKFNTAKVPKALINDAVKAAQANGVDPYDLLGLIGQESTFGMGYTKTKEYRGAPERKITDISQRQMVSGWNLVPNVKRPQMFLADKQAPGVKVKKNPMGYLTEIEDYEGLKNYTDSHPELAAQYATQLVGTGDLSGDPDFFDMAAKHIKQNGFKKYNPGDPDYPNKVAQSKALLMKDKALSSYVSGLKFEKGGKVKGDLAQGEMVEFSGPSHAQGGIDIAYGGKKVEVEGGETAFVGNDGDLNILGNMYIPGTKVKFKSAGKVIAKEEEKNNKLMDEGLTLIEKNADPMNFNQTLGFKTGKVMMEGSKMQENNLNQKKERLANLQQAILADMNQGYAARGATLTDDDPKKKKSMAVRMNNPGNIKFGEWAKKHGAVKGDPATDGGYFAKFPDVNTGLSALKGLLKTKNYKDLPVDAAIKRWTNNAGYAVDYKDIANKKISELDPKQFDKLVNTITYGEDSKYYSPDVQTPPGAPKKDVPVPPFTPFKLTDTPQNQAPPASPDPNNPEYVPIDYNIQPPNVKNPAPYQSPLDWRQLTGEIYSLATNRVEPVPMQKFTPELESPYSVSFQDRINANQATFNALNRSSSGNPEALSVLAGQKYAADSNILGEEFRTNQTIFNEITNRNLTKLDDAELKNLGLADQQMVRQSTARSKTKAQTQLTLQSIGDKTIKNKYENLDSAFKQMMFKYRPADKDGDGVFESMEYQGEAPTFTPNTNSATNANQYIKERKEYDGTGTLKKTQTTEPSDMEKQNIKAKALKAYWDISVNQYNNLFKRSR